MYNIFSSYLINSTILGEGKKIENEICILIFSNTFARPVFHSKKNWAIYGQIGVSVCV